MASLLITGAVLATITTPLSMQAFVEGGEGHHGYHGGHHNPSAEAGNGDNGSGPNGGKGGSGGAGGTHGGSDPGLPGHHFPNMHRSSVYNTAYLNSTGGRKILAR